MENILLKPFTLSDIYLWEVWKSKLDFLIYQTHLFPEVFNLNIDNYKIYIINSGEISIGSIWLEKIDIIKKLAWLGLFIGEPSFWNKGFGQKAINLMLNIAFYTSGLEEVWLNVREKNQRAISCYEKVGFRKVNKLGPRAFGDGTVQYWFEMVVRKKEI